MRQLEARGKEFHPSQLIDYYQPIGKAKKEKKDAEELGHSNIMVVYQHAAEFLSSVAAAVGEGELGEAGWCLPLASSRLLSHSLFYSTVYYIQFRTSNSEFLISIF